MEQVVALVNVEGGDGGENVGVHFNGDVKVVGGVQGGERGQSLQRHHGVLREESQRGECCLL